MQWSGAVHSPVFISCLCSSPRPLSLILTLKMIVEICVPHFPHKCLYKNKTQSKNVHSFIPSLTCVYVHFKDMVNWSNSGNILVWKVSIYFATSTSMHIPIALQGFSAKPTHHVYAEICTTSFKKSFFWVELWRDMRRIYVPHMSGWEGADPMQCDNFEFRHSFSRDLMNSF